MRGCVEEGERSSDETTWRGGECRAVSQGVGDGEFAVELLYVFMHCMACMGGLEALEGFRQKLTWRFYSKQGTKVGNSTFDGRVGESDGQVGRSTDEQMGRVGRLDRVGRSVGHST